LPVRIEYKAAVEKDLRKLDKHEALRVIDKLEKVLSANPNAGEALSGEYKGLFKFRVGDYRIMYAKKPDGVLVVRIRHRKHAY